MIFSRQNMYNKKETSQKTEIYFVANSVDE